MCKRTVLKFQFEDGLAPFAIASSTIHIHVQLHRSMSLYCLVTIYGYVICMLLFMYTYVPREHMKPQLQLRCSFPSGYWLSRNTHARGGVYLSCKTRVSSGATPTSCLAFFALSFSIYCRVKFIKIIAPNLIEA